MTSHVVDRAPLAVAYGAGVDSTALLVGFVRRGVRPAYILFADTGGEKEETLAFRKRSSHGVLSSEIRDVQEEKNRS
jgi:3'-phosphoadenosine 5'-phosphosulfate sulfotransferase (PAPS reductase)/FAD synthetase